MRLFLSGLNCTNFFSSCRITQLNDNMIVSTVFLTTYSLYLTNIFDESYALNTDENFSKTFYLKFTFLNTFFYNSWPRWKKSMRAVTNSFFDSISIYISVIWILGLKKKKQFLKYVTGMKLMNQWPKMYYFKFIKTM